MPKPQSPVGARMISWSHMPLWLLCISLMLPEESQLIRKVACLEMQRLSAFGGVLGRCGRASHGSSNWEHSSNRGAAAAQKIELAGNVREQSSTGGWMELQAAVCSVA